MILSASNKYVFIETPQTASTAIGKELCELYDGQPILRKHSSYSDLTKAIGGEAKNFTIFATIRSPMDIVVSKYYKAKNDHNGVFNLTWEKALNDGITFSWIFRKEYREFRYIQAHNATFRQYFRKFYKHVYNSRVCMLPNEVRLVRYENLNEDFSAMLRSLNINQIRKLPQKNITEGKVRNFWQYYTPDLRQQAIAVFGPFMDKWGYSFPTEWSTANTPKFSCFFFKIDCALRTIYFNKLHYQYFAPHPSLPVIT